MLKGESEQDTIGVLDSLGFDGVILRSSSNYLLDEMRLKYSRMTFLDAGQGSSTHPTQAFGDLLSMALYGELDLATARVVVLGDISHSRVCASLREALWSYGNRVRTAVVDTVYEADVLYCLRPQVERGYDLDAYDLVQLYGVTEELLEKTGAYLMHPGPYVGVEFGRHLLNHPKSLVKRQVETGLAVRKAYLVEEFSGN